MQPLFKTRKYYYNPLIPHYGFGEVVLLLKSKFAFLTFVLVIFLLTHLPTILTDLSLLFYTHFFIFFSSVTTNLTILL